MSVTLTCLVLIFESCCCPRFTVSSVADVNMCMSQQLLLTSFPFCCHCHH
jgi:hypothetical protein